MPLTRRNFLGRSLAMAGAAAVVPSFVVNGFFAPRAALAAGAKTKVLVMLRLYGVNDGLNTVVPYGIGAYYDNRPTLAVPANQVLAIDGTIGLHPRMTALKQHYDAGRL